MAFDSSASDVRGIPFVSFFQTLLRAVMLEAAVPVRPRKDPNATYPPDRWSAEAPFLDDSWPHG
jgi:hypothetical protein